MSQDKPFSQACENNKDPILKRLRDVFDRPGTVLEIGTGTGQHAVYFAHRLPHIIWQPSDHPDNAGLCRARLEEAALANVRPVVALDVNDEDWPVPVIDGAFSANTAHIMAWSEVVAMFRGVGRRLSTDQAFCLYGPFNYHGRYTSASNQRFDQHLKSRGAHMGIRDISDLNELAETAGLVLADDCEMPANNRLLVWRAR